MDFVQRFISSDTRARLKQSRLVPRLSNDVRDQPGTIRLLYRGGRLRGRRSYLSAMHRSLCVLPRGVVYSDAPPHVQEVSFLLQRMRGVVATTSATACKSRRGRVHCPDSSPPLSGQLRSAAPADLRLCTAVQATRNRDVWLFRHCFHFAPHFRIGQTVDRCEAPARRAEIRGLTLVHPCCGPLNGPAVCVEPEVELQ